jgi:hypothetical protein
MHSVNSQLTGLMKNLSRILVIIYLAAGCSKQINHKSSDTDQQITFGPKVFKDSGEYVYVTGTLTGEDVPNNTVVVTCEKQRMECVTCSVWQIGKNHRDWRVSYRLARGRWRLAGQTDSAIYSRT